MTLSREFLEATVQHGAYVLDLADKLASEVRKELDARGLPPALEQALKAYEAERS